MDIHKWLDETILPERPPSPSRPEHLGLAHFLHPKPPAREPEEGHRQKRAMSDSSLLDARTACRKSSPMKRHSDIVDSGDEGRSSPAHQQPDHSTASSASSQHYARKPRRKTRPERYEPTSKDAKGRGSQLYRHRKGESKKTRHTSRRKQAEKPGVGLVQSFHARNVPKDRLTLKPREKLGLFNKGRASSPVKGRGLPDLVFSEMKFLQKHKGQPDAAPHAGLAKKKRKKDNAHTKQDEISAYFTSVRPALAEKDVNTQAREGTRRKSLQPDTHRERERSSLADNAIHTVEVPDNVPYLGFGSRGPRHESGSYVSWSESIRAPSGTPMRIQQGSATNADQLGSIHGRKDNTDAKGMDMLDSRAPLPVSRDLTERCGGRFQISPLVPANDRVVRPHSSPQHACSPRPPMTEERPGRRRTAETDVSPSSMPPVMPPKTAVRSKRRSERRSAARPEPVRESGHTPLSTGNPEPVPRYSYRRGDESDCSVPCDGEPQTSSSLGMLLQECNRVIDEHQRQPVPAYGSNEVCPGPLDLQHNERVSVNTLAYGGLRNVPTVRFAGVETCRPQLPSYTGPSIYEEQERRQSTAGAGGLHDGVVFQEAFSIGHGHGAHGNGDLNYEFDEQVDGPLAFGLDTDITADDFGRAYEARYREAEPLERDGVVARGFWRPHKLY